MVERETRVEKEVWKEFASLLGNLPLENCNREHIAVTREWGWKAPKDKVFRISGNFIIWSEQSDLEDMGRPLESVGALKESHQKEYREFLEEAEGDESRAIDLLYDDIHDELRTPPKFFDGKWLVVSPDLKQDPKAKEASKLDMPQIKVKSDVQAWAEREYLQGIDDISPQSPIVTDILFASQILAKKWKQYFAEAVLGKCKIDLIDFPDSEKKEGFYIPEAKDDKHLYLPEGTRKRGGHSDYEFAVRTRTRMYKGQEKEPEKVVKNTSGLFFVKSSLFPDLLIAQRMEKIIFPKKLH